jgi:SAM-dependent methyltransferase
MVHRAPPTNLNYWVQNKTGFEIGGPSENTFGSLGVYDIAAKVDVTNFAADTLWEKGLKDGSPFLWKNQSKGTQYIRDAVDLHGIPNELYDFVAASHVLEHIANPFKALLEWLRILRSGGLLILITPFKGATFDHKRDIVRIEHLINDYHNQTSEADLSHLDEILRLHDLGLDPPAGDPHSFKARSEKNFQNRALHQHVYDQELLYYIFQCLNLDVKIQITSGNNDIIIGQKKITFVD